MKYWKVPAIVLGLSLLYLYLDVNHYLPEVRLIAILPADVVTIMAEELFTFSISPLDGLNADVDGVSNLILRTLMFMLTISLVALPWFLWQLKRKPKYLKFGVAAIVIYLGVSVGFYFFLVFILVPVMSWG